jgi:hypothetical protein
MHARSSSQRTCARTAAWSISPSPSNGVVIGGMIPNNFAMIGLPSGLPPV